MTTNTYKQHLQQRLSAIERDMTRARNKLQTSPLESKASALGEISKLEVKHKNLSERIAALSDESAEKWSETKTGFQEEIDGLTETLENLILRGI